MQLEVNVEEVKSAIRALHSLTSLPLFDRGMQLFHAMLLKLKESEFDAHFSKEYGDPETRRYGIYSI